MRILTHENKSYNLDRIPDEVEDIRFCVFDCSDRKNTDYYFNPMIFLESFYCPAVVLEIGNFKVKLPIDWSIVVCDEDMTDLEIMPLTSLNDRGFHTPVYNPLHHMVSTSQEVNIVDVYSDIKWFSPRLKGGSMLVLPLQDNVEKPLCIVVVKDKGKIPSDLDIAELFS